MIGYLYIDDKMIGEVNFEIIDEGMGVIGGDLVSNDNYKKFQAAIQECYERKGIANIQDFDFRIQIDNLDLMPEGGIGVTDSKEFGEIFVESGGLDQITLEKVRSKSESNGL